MNIIVPIKVLADDQDIVVAADRSLDDSKAHRIVSTYDLNAIEAAVQLASAHEELESRLRVGRRREGRRLQAEEVFSPAAWTSWS